MCAQLACLALPSLIGTYVAAPAVSGVPEPIMPTYVACHMYLVCMVCLTTDTCVHGEHAGPVVPGAHGLTCVHGVHGVHACIWIDVRMDNKPIEMV